MPLPVEKRRGYGLIGHAQGLGQYGVEHVIGVLDCLDKGEDGHGLAGDFAVLVGKLAQALLDVLLVGGQKLLLVLLKNGFHKSMKIL